METVVVERTFPEPQDFEELEARERAVSDCLSVRRVSALCSYFSRDRRTLVCLYEAPDAEAVRQVQQESGLGYERIWRAIRLRDILTTDPSPRVPVIVQRLLPEGTTLDDVRAMGARADGCLGLYNVTHYGTLLSPDLRRGVCFYAAPDAEALRIVNETASMPSELVFTATIHTPSE